MDPHEQRWRIAPDASPETTGRAHEPAVDRRTVVGRPCRPRWARAGRATRTRRPARAQRRCAIRPTSRTRRSESGYERPSARRRARSPRHDRPPCTPLGRARATARVAMSTRRSEPNPSSLRVNTIDEPSGDHANERWPSPHDGSPCSSCSSTTGLASDPSRRPATGSTSPSRRTGRRARPVGREARLLHARAVATATTTRGRGVGARHGAYDDAACVPRHRRNVPLVPRDMTTVGRPRGVEAEVGITGQPHGPCRPVERRDRRRASDRRRTRHDAVGTRSPARRSRHRDACPRLAEAGRRPPRRHSAPSSRRRRARCRRASNRMRHRRTPPRDAGVGRWSRPPRDHPQSASRPVARAATFVTNARRSPSGDSRGSARTRPYGTIAAATWGMGRWRARAHSTGFST